MNYLEEELLKKLLYFVKGLDLLFFKNYTNISYCLKYLNILQSENK